MTQLRCPERDCREKWGVRRVQKKVRRAFVRTLDPMQPNLT